MKTIPNATPEPKARKYDSIGNETRRTFFTLILRDKQPLSVVCQMLQLKQSTAKSLLQRFKKNGRLDRLNGRSYQQDASLL